MNGAAYMWFLNVAHVTSQQCSAACDHDRRCEGFEQAFQLARQSRCWLLDGVTLDRCDLDPEYNYWEKMPY